MFDFLTTKLSSIFSRLTGQAYLSEKNISEVLLKVKNALLESDVPYNVVEQFTDEVQREVIGQKVFSSLKPSEQFIDVIHKKLIAFLGGASTQESFDFKTPSIFMVMGLQGSGKTTTIGKLAQWLVKENAKKNKKLKVLCGSVDFYRPAAVDQLEILAKQAGVAFYRAPSPDPCKAAEQIAAYARKNQFDFLFLDTAGRLHIDDSMLEELRTIDFLVSPHHKILVLDAMTGQESLHVAQAFEKNIGFKGAILSKIDSDTRGGGAFALAYGLKKPILFLGIGEKLPDLEPFRAERIAGQMLGMGDMQTLVERANEKMKKHELDEAEKAFKRGTFSLQDFAKQIEMVNRMGSFSQLVKFIPGISSESISSDKMLQAESEIKRFKAIISSMTPKERLNHAILQASRKVRIAKGAGVQVTDINILLKRFEEMQQFAKLFKKMGKGL